VGRLASVHQGLLQNKEVGADLEAARGVEVEEGVDNSG
jgi:hypothetical protein